MKVTVAITNDSFKWAYKIGSSEQKGSTCLTSGSFLSFAQILQVCQHAMDSNAKEKLNKLMSEVGARKYIEENLNEATEYINKLSNITP